jgi:hypothetical protein
MLVLGKSRDFDKYSGSENTIMLCENATNIIIYLFVLTLINCHQKYHVQLGMVAISASDS